MITLKQAVLISAHPEYYHTENLIKCLELLVDHPELTGSIQRVIDQRTKNS